LIEEVELLDKYENDEKFGDDKMSYAYRIIYRSIERTLTSEEVDVLHKELEAATTEQFAATVR
jgi:phenylalanyl-tRNA synthetase beta subunit